jgi:hypothetical protein
MMAVAAMGPIPGMERLQQIAIDYGPAAERIAFLCSSTLQKIQYRRIAPQQMFAYFLDEAQARDWLLADGPGL